MPISLLEGGMSISFPGSGIMGRPPVRLAPSSMGRKKRKPPGLGLGLREIIVGWQKQIAVGRKEGVWEWVWALLAEGGAFSHICR